MSLCRYFEAHLAVKAEQVKQSLHSPDGSAVVPQQPFYKVSRLDLGLFVQTSFKMCGAFMCGSSSPGVHVHQRAGHRDDGVPHRVRTSSAPLGTSGGLLQTLLRPSDAAAHFCGLWLEDLLRQVKPGDDTQHLTIHGVEAGTVIIPDIRLPLRYPAFYQRRNISPFIYNSQVLFSSQYSTIKNNIKKSPHWSVLWRAKKAQIKIFIIK